MFKSQFPTGYVNIVPLVSFLFNLIVSSFTYTPQWSYFKQTKNYIFIMGNIKLKPKIYSLLWEDCIT